MMYNHDDDYYRAHKVCDGLPNSVDQHSSVCDITSVGPIGTALSNHWSARHCHSTPCVAGAAGGTGNGRQGASFFHHLAEVGERATRMVPVVEAEGARAEREAQREGAAEDTVAAAPALARSSKVSFYSKFRV